MIKSIISCASISLLLLACGNVGTDPYDLEHPVAIILIPDDSTHYAFGTVASFLGQGVGQNGDTLAGEALRWTSSINGELGTGTSCSAETLSEGVHTIRLQIVDHDTNMAEAAITVFVDEDSTTGYLTSGILAPYTNAVYAEGDSVLFEGWSISSRGDSLKGASLVWISDMDGQLGFGQALVCTTLTPNTHKVTMMAVENESTVVIKYISLVVTGRRNLAPTAYFTVSPDTGALSTPFIADASGCTDNDDPDDDLQVRWDWDNSGTFSSWSKSKTASHTYSSVGVKTIVMEVKDTDGLTDSYSREVIVRSLAPTAFFTVSPETGTIATQFTVNASGSSDPDGDVGDLQVKWQWDAASSYGALTRIKTALHTYATIGTKTITVEVQDADGLTDSYSLPVVIVNTPPKAAFQVIPGTGDTTTTFQMNASDSRDLEDNAAILEIRWDWEGDGTWDTFWGTLKTASHLYPDSGLYDMTMEVRDSERMSDTLVVQVQVD